MVNGWGTITLALIYRTMIEEDDDRVLYVNVPNIQQQTGADDCGLFAIAFAIHAAAHGNCCPEVNFNQAEMRSHLKKCFSKKQLLPFPTKESQNSFSNRNSFFPCRPIELHCLCNMPESYGDMIECEECSLWFHIKCMPNLQCIPDTWHCQNCDK